MAKKRAVNRAGNNKIQLSTTVSPEALRLLEAHAKKEDRTVSSALDRLLLRVLGSAP